jgi:hypothetical protein
VSEDEFDVEIDGEPSVEEKIDALAKEPLISTGKPPSPESVAEAKRIAAELQAHTEADPDEEPPEPEGHRLSQVVADYLGAREYFHGPLPHDIAAIWGHPPIRHQDEATCRILIGAWGVDEFRGSQLHQAALQDRARSANTHEARTRFKAEREKEKKRR